MGEEGARGAETLIRPLGQLLLTRTMATRRLPFQTREHAAPRAAAVESHFRTLVARSGKTQGGARVHGRQAAHQDRRGRNIKNPTLTNATHPWRRNLHFVGRSSPCARAQTHTKTIFALISETRTQEDNAAKGAFNSRRPTGICTCLGATRVASQTTKATVIGSPPNGEKRAGEELHLR